MTLQHAIANYAALLTESIRRADDASVCWASTPQIQGLTRQLNQAKELRNVPEEIRASRIRIACS